MVVGFIRIVVVFERPSVARFHASRDSTPNSASLEFSVQFYCNLVEFILLIEESLVVVTLSTVFNKIIIIIASTPQNLRLYLLRLREHGIFGDYVQE